MVCLRKTIEQTEHSLYRNENTASLSSEKEYSSYGIEMFLVCYGIRPAKDR